MTTYTFAYLSYTTTFPTLFKVKIDLDCLYFFLRFITLKDSVGRDYKNLNEYYFILLLKCIAMLI